MSDVITTTGYKVTDEDFEIVFMPDDSCYWARFEPQAAAEDIESGEARPPMKAMHPADEFKDKVEEQMASLQAIVSGMQQVLQAYEEIEKARAEE